MLINKSIRSTSIIKSANTLARRHSISTLALNTHIQMTLTNNNPSLQSMIRGKNRLRNRIVKKDLKHKAPNDCKV